MVQGLGSISVQCLDAILDPACLTYQSDSGGFAMKHGQRLSCGAQGVAGGVWRTLQHVNQTLIL